MSTNMYLVEFRKSNQPNKATVLLANSMSDAINRVKRIKNNCFELSDHFHEITLVTPNQIIELKDRLI